LTKTELNKALSKLSDWKCNPKGTALTRTFAFKTHVDALVFIARVSVHAQVIDHHPQILFTYAHVKITLTTDSIKALSKYDIALAERIDSISRKGG
jgi:4a-hydroxytetrahydrobiopterin dehydratase